jgi:hypothetical protein
MGCLGTTGNVAIRTGDAALHSPTRELHDMSRAFVDDDKDDAVPRRNYGLPPRDDAGFDEAAARAILEAARAGETAAAEAATGYYWGEPRLKPWVERVLAEAVQAGDERLEQLARRFLR